MPTIPGSTRQQSGLYYDKGGGVVNLLHPEFGLDGTGGVDSTDAFQAAVNAGFPAYYLPDNSNILITKNTGVIVGSGFKLYGKGRITFSPSVASAGRAIAVGDPNSTTNTAKSGVVIDGPEFYSTIDQEFITFVDLQNKGGDLTDVRIRALFTYKPATITGGDRWAVSFGGLFGNQRARIYLDNCRLYGPMQLSANGGDPDYTDIFWINPIVSGGRNACIALTRLSTSANQNNYKNIKVLGGSLQTDRSICVFFGADSDTTSTAPMNWDRVLVAGVDCRIEGAGGVNPNAVLFRAPEGASSSFKGKIRDCSIRASSGAVVTCTYSRPGTSIPPGTYEVDILRNAFEGADVIVSGTTKAQLRGNESDSSFLPSLGAVVEMENNKFASLRMEDAATVISRNNEYIVRAASARAVNVNSASGKNNVLTSTDDTFDWRGTSGNAAEAIRLLGLGTMTVKLRTPNYAYTGWANGGAEGLNLQNSQKLAEYRPRNPIVSVNNTAVGNVGTGEDDLMTYATIAGALSAVKRGYRITAWLQAANNANAKTVKLYFSTSVIATQALTVSQACEVKIVAEVFVTSLGANQQDYEVWLFQDGTTQIQKIFRGQSTAVEENSFTIKCTGTATADNDIVQEGMLIEAIG